MARSGWPLALLLVVGASGLSGCGGSAASTDKSVAAETGTPRAARVTKVETRALSANMTANGVLTPVELVSITSDLPGVLVRRVGADTGAVVKAGQVLVELDGAVLDAQIAQVRAKVAQQSVAVRQAQQESARSAKLKGKQVIADEAIAARGFRAASASAGLQMAQAELAELTLRRQRMALRTPVSGVVVERNVAVGDLTGSSPRPMLTVVPFGGTQLKVEVPETRLGELAPGTPATIALADGRRFSGKVSRIGGKVQSGTALAEVFVSLGAPLTASNMPLRVGMSGTAEFALGAGSVAAVPEKALIYDSAGASVMVLGDNNRTRKIKVVTGTRANGYVQLVEGPPAGTTVLLGAGAFVADGDAVAPVAADQAAP